MEMHKFIIEIHPDGRMTCCEYEEPRDVSESSWLAGYRQALAHCNEQVGFLGAFKDTSLTANIRYQGAVQVRDVVASYYHNYSND